MNIDYTKFVNIDVGTDSEYRESNGNTLPNVQYPFGNQAYVFQTNKADGGWFYKPRANYIEGIRVTNQPSPWLGDYGQITLLPFNGRYDLDLHTSISGKSHSPYQIEACLNRYDIDVKLTPTQNGAKLIANSKNQNTDLYIDCHNGLSTVEVADDSISITTYNGPDTSYGKNYRKFYKLEFNSHISSFEIYQDHNLTDKLSGENLEIIVRFERNNFELNLASSYISHEFATNHIASQLLESYDVTCNQTKTVWNQYLHSIEIDEDDEQMRKFYSNLYRCFCYPRTISEADDNSQQVYYNFKNKTIDSGVMIADVGFWDTYRTTMPLYKKIIPNQYRTMVDAILNYYQSYGWLPRWLAPFERGIMPSTLVDSIICSAIIDGDIENSRIDLAIESVLQNADVENDNKLFGREMIKQYNQYGFVPKTKGIESVSLSLDNYYCDYAIGRALSHVGHQRAQEFIEKAQNYKKLFNPQTKMFESVLEDGQFDPNFCPYEWGTDFCESSAYQNNLNIFHDTAGVIDLFGGKEQVESRLDFLFESRPKYDVGRYGFEIHEMTEFAKIRDLGQFAISNQPSFNLPFWYLHIDQESKFETLINKTLNHFTAEVDGYPGDEDNGSLAAWYILVTIGIYPFCPVDDLIEFTPKLKYKINTQF